jgi:hypothetical protein
VQACLTLGIHYLDLADGSEFVKGIAQFDGEARARNLVILSGVSSFPVLTAAVVRSLSAGMTRIETVTGGIAPSPYAGVGLNVIRAIASYAGKPLDLGPNDRRYALIDARRYVVRPPGRLPLPPIRYSLVDVPDLRVLPDLWPGLRTIWMGAGPVPEILHRALNACAWLVRLKILPSLVPFARLMYGTINVLRWGEHRGGMFVAVEGVGAGGETIKRSWHMVAEEEDGPFIPSMAAEAIIRHWLDGRRPVTGARASTTDLELSDYDVLFARRKIFSGMREPPAAAAPLYRRVLGEAWEALPKPLRDMHDLKDNLVAEGVSAVDRGSSLLARLIGAIMGFPKAGKDIPVRVDFRRENGREIWQRDFAGRVFSSTQEEGRGRFEGLVCERFGPLGFGLALVLDGGRMNIVVRRWSAFGIPMPLVLAPTGEAHESADDGRFNFHVEMRHPLAGLIVRYRGWLTPRS